MNNKRLSEELTLMLEEAGSRQTPQEAVLVISSILTNLAGNKNPTLVNAASDFSILAGVKIAQPTDKSLYFQQPGSGRNLEKFDVSLQDQ